MHFYRSVLVSLINRSFSRARLIIDEQAPVHVWEGSKLPVSSRIIRYSLVIDAFLPDSSKPKA